MAVERVVVARRGDARQSAHELAAEAVPLPVVFDRHRHFCVVGTALAVVARHPDDLVVANGDERLDGSNG